MTDGDPTKDNPVSAAHVRGKELEGYILEHSRGAEAGDTVAGGHMARGAVKPGSDNSANGKKKSDDMVQAVIDNTTAAIQEDLKRLYEEQERLYDRLSDLELKTDKLEQVSKDIEHGRIPEIGPDGKLRDAELEAMVAGEEKRLGHSVDRSNPQALMAIFADENRRVVTERSEVLEAIARNEAEIEAVQNGRELEEKPTSDSVADSHLKTANALDVENSQRPDYSNEFDQFSF